MRVKKEKKSTPSRGRGVRQRLTKKKSTTMLSLKLLEKENGKKRATIIKKRKKRGVEQRGVLTAIFCVKEEKEVS